MKKNRGLLFKQVCCILGYLVIIFVVSIFNTFSLKDGLISVNNLYWILFGLFLLFSLCIPVFVYLGFRTMLNLSPERLKEKYADIWKQYSLTFIKEHPDKKLNGKTRANADLYFSSEDILSASFLNIPVLDYLKNVSGTFVGLGILGTFVGFSQFLGNIIECGINFESVEIFNGLKVAFNTSIIGLFSSIIYNLLITQPLLSLVKESNRLLCDSLDEQYYVSDEQCMRSLSDIVSITETSIDKNITNMCVEIKNVISAERDEFTKQVLGTAELLKHIDNSLGNIPDNVKLMSDELNKSIGLAKTRTLEMSQECLKSINTELNKTFEQFTERFDKASLSIEKATDSVSSFPADLKSEMSSITHSLQNNFDVLSNKIDSDLSVVFEETKKEISSMIKEETKADIERNQTLMDASENRLKIVYEDAEQKLNSFLDGTKSIINAIYGEMVRNISEACNSFSSKISDSIVRIEDFSKETNNFTNEYKKLHETLINMSIRITESEESLINGTVEIKNLLNNFITASNLMRDAQQNLKDISESLNKFPEQQREMNMLYSNAAEVMKNSLVQMIDHVNNVLDEKNKESEESES